jgi:FHS family L-fucose permease-like MFS transporter
MKTQRPLLLAVYAIYFTCGLAMCFEGFFMPEFKTHFSLSYTEQMYTMLAKNLPFVLVSIPVGFLTQRLGFKRCLTVALVLFAGGTYLLVPGLETGSYSLVLAGFFLIGIGFNVELVAGNPLLAALGDPAGSASRLNVGNALGAVAQIVAPLLVVALIPATVTAVAEKLPIILGIFKTTVVLLAAMGVLTVFLNEPRTRLATPAASGTVPTASRGWLQPKVVLGFVAIFLVIGVEAGLFGLYRNYVEDPAVAGLTAHQSQRWFTGYFAVFALGRLVGSYVQKTWLTPAVTMAVCLLVSLGLVAVVVFATGWMAVGAITALGFFVSIFFPTLYALAIEGLGAETGRASGLLTMGFLGAALIPVLQGRLADTLGLPASFAVAFGPYVFALGYIFWGERRKEKGKPSVTA